MTNVVGSRILSLFSGVGGLDIAVHLALPGSRVVGYVERDAYASATLMARMEESSLDPAPVFVGEIQDVDGSEFRGCIDVVCGGIPCQPYSVAGSQLGNEDERALWHEFARIVSESRPSLVFIENVPTFVTGGGFRPLGEELCGLGYELADPFFIGAADVGAPHERQRVFILAHRDLDRSEAERRERELVAGVGAAFGDDPDRRDQELEPARETGGSLGEGGVPDAERDALWDESKRRGNPARSPESWNSILGNLGLFPPGPDDEAGWESTLRQAGYLAPALKPGFRVVANGVSMVLDASGPDQLRCAGNAVVVAQAYVAFRQLLRWAGRDR
jgi:DNA (cytosine-5)-methyltransferase 1